MCAWCVVSGVRGEYSHTPLRAACVPRGSAQCARRPPGCTSSAGCLAGVRLRLRLGRVGVRAARVRVRVSCQGQGQWPVASGQWSVVRLRVRVVRVARVICGTPDPDAEGEMRCTHAALRPHRMRAEAVQER